MRAGIHQRIFEVCRSSRTYTPSWDGKNISGHSTPHIFVTFTFTHTHTHTHTHSLSTSHNTQAKSPQFNFPKLSLCHKNSLTLTLFYHGCHHGIPHTVTFWTFDLQYIPCTHQKENLQLYDVATCFFRILIHGHGHRTHSHVFVQLFLVSLSLSIFSLSLSHKYNMRTDICTFMRS